MSEANNTTCLPVVISWKKVIMGLREPDSWAVFIRVVLQFNPSNLCMSTIDI